MPHRVGAWLAAAARSATASALLVVTGCASDDAELVVVVSGGSGRSVIASPVDPRRLHAAVASRSRAAGPLRDSIARYYALADSADSLDTIFQAQRDALNREARGMAGGDRRTRAYAQAYDAYVKRAAAATRTRDGRDGARRRAAVLRSRLRRCLPELQRSSGGAGLRAALDSAALAHGGEVRRASLRSRHATLKLAPGVWWIAVEDESGELTGTRRHEVRPGAQDTVRIGS